MAQKYMLIPLPNGLFSGLDLCTRAVLGALCNRVKLSNYHLIGDAASPWFDQQEQQVYCVYTHAELAGQLGVSERTVRRCLDTLRAEQFIWWRKATYKGANRYFVDNRIMQELKSQ